jgi:dihydroorotase
LLFRAGPLPYKGLTGDAIFKFLTDVDEEYTFFNAWHGLFIWPGRCAIVQHNYKRGSRYRPKNNIDGVMDVAIADGKIAQVSKNIDAQLAKQVIDAKGLYVTPGLIDIHSHNFFGTQPDHQYENGNLALPPDGFTFRNGVTTVVDAGSSGWRTFPTFKAQTIDESQTRVLAFINIVGEGMRGGYEQDMNDMDPKMSAMVARRYKKYVVGFKLAHYEGHEWAPIDRAVEAGKLAGGLPVMVDFGGSNPPCR